MQYDIKNRWTGAVQFTAEIDCAKGAPHGVKVWLAVRWALRNGATLTGAVLTGADLTGATLTGEDLTGAVLTGAVLTGADLTGADLTGATLTGATGVIDAGVPNGWRCVGWLRGGWLSVRVGCRDKRSHEGRDYWAGKDYRREVLAALDYVEAVAKLRGWAVTEPVDHAPGVIGRLTESARPGDNELADLIEALPRLDNAPGSAEVGLGDLTRWMGDWMERDWSDGDEASEEAAKLMGEALKWLRTLSAERDRQAEEIERLRRALSDMLEDGDKTDRQAHRALPNKEAGDA
jgi:hypothetical protein